MEQSVTAHSERPQKRPADMNKPPNPSSIEWQADLAIAAKHRIGFIRWLAEYMGPRWDVMTPAGQDLIRAEARMVLEQMVEGCS